jgi:pSer/pThr/pTyr-binding forkhead associated (FHA) protein
MRDGKTRRREAGTSGPDIETFFSRYCATIVIIEGGAAGSEYTLDRTQVTMGRGPGVDLAFDDPSMSREHAALELVTGGFRIRDLGSTNGLIVNGSPCEVAKLKHGDRFQIGDYRFQYLLEERERGPREYELPEQ